MNPVKPPPAFDWCASVGRCAREHSPACAAPNLYDPDGRCALQEWPELVWRATVWVSSPFWTSLILASQRLVGPGSGDEIDVDYIAADGPATVAFSWDIGPMRWEPAMDALERAKRRLALPRPGVVRPVVTGSRLASASGGTWERGLHRVS